MNNLDFFIWRAFCCRWMVYFAFVEAFGGPAFFMELVFSKWVCTFLLCCWLIFSGAYSGRLYCRQFVGLSLIAININLVANGFLMLYSRSQVEGLHRNSKVRGVNLGGWLVVEGWIKPSLFDGIPNGDMLVSFFSKLCCLYDSWT